MQRVPNTARSLLAVLTATGLLSCTQGSAEAPPVNSSAWSWAAAGPGVNIYVAYRGASRPLGMQSAWVDRRYFSNLAGVNADVIEVRQLDCRHARGDRRSEPANDGSSRLAPASGARAETLNQRILEMVCGQERTQ